MSDWRINSPMSVGIILDKSINFILSNIVWIAALGFLISLPELIFKLSVEHVSNEGFTPYLFKLAEFVMSMLFTPVLAGMVTLMIAEHMCGRSLSSSEALAKTLKKLPRLLGLSCITTIATLLGFLCLVIPGFIVVAAITCAVPALMLEDLRPMKAFDRSWALTKGSRCRMLGYLMINGLVLFVFGATKGLLENFVPNSIYLGLIVNLISAPCLALWPAMDTLLFYDLRIRKEALDLEVESNTIAVEAEVTS